MRKLIARLGLAGIVLAAGPVMGAEKDPRAVEVAERLMTAMGGKEAFESQRLLRFDWSVERDGEIASAYKHWWDGRTGRYRLEWTDPDGKEFRVLFNVNDRQGEVWSDGARVEGEDADRALGTAYARFINDTYWLLMPWKWLDPGVNLKYEGERELGGEKYDVVLLTFETGVGLTSGDRYWGYVSKDTGLMERWEYVLQDEDGNPGGAEPTVWTWGGWREGAGGILFSTRKERVGGEPKLAITFPVAHLSQEAPAVVFNPILRPASSDAPPDEPSGTPPSRAEVNELLIVLNKSDHTAALVELGSMDVLRTVPTGVGPHEGAVSRDGRTLYVSNYGGRTPGNTLSVIDLPTGTVQKVVDLGEHTRPHGVAVGPDGSVWVTAEGSRSVLRLSPGDLEVQRVYKTDQDVTHMIVLTPDGSRAFTANIGSGSVTAIAAESGKVVSVPTGAGAEGIDIAPDGREVWVAHRDDDDLAILDARTLKVKGRLPTCSFPIRVKFTSDGTKVLVSCAQSNELQVIDPLLRSELARVKLVSVPIGIQIAPGDEVAFVANTQADMISLVDLEQLRLLGTFFAGREPDGLAWAKWDPPEAGD